MLQASDLLVIATLYATVNNDDWTWLPLLTISLFKSKLQIYFGYILASAALYFTCYAISLLADRETIEIYFNGSGLSQTIGIIFILLGVWRAFHAFILKKTSAAEAVFLDETPAQGWTKYPFMVAMGMVFANGYNNVLVLSPIFADAGAQKALAYALALPLFNLMFASILIVAMTKFEKKTIVLTSKYAGPVGSIAMILLGIKIAFF